MLVLEQCDIKQQAGEQDEHAALEQLVAHQVFMVEAQPEQQVATGDSVLDKFLDARGYEEKLDVLIRYKSRFTNPMIDIMAESLEIVVPEGELSGRIDSLRKVLQAHTKYEGSHLRP